MSARSRAVVRRKQERVFWRVFVHRLMREVLRNAAYTAGIGVLQIRIGRPLTEEERQMWRERVDQMEVQV